MAIGGVLVIGLRDVPAVISDYVDVPAIGLILIWSGLLLLAMQVVLHRPRTARRRPSGGDAPWSVADEWYDRDVHRPGYAGKTQQLPKVRGRRPR